jgi:asparagine synthase (glutamine-hydrolysing)
MCGITGIWTPDGDQEGIRLEVSRAVESLRHRGPDDNGICLNESGVALGHTRLSILDLSSAGHQPMTSASGRYVIVYNGEFYNFAEVRAALVDAGHTFSGTGDTEVILAAFEKWGAKAVDRIIGMFAFAIWDKETRRLELYRDRMGVKPLYFGWDGKSLCFGSELKSLRAFKHWRPEIDRQSLAEYLQYGYIAGDRTIYKGIYKLKPGHRLALVEGGEPVIEPYWSILDTLDERPSGDDATIESELEDLLIDSFRYRMVSDVPVGVYLSGGIDSSLVTAILARHHDQDIRTYTIGFSEDKFDESRWARKVAEHCGTVHTDYILDVNEGLQIAREWGSLFDEPFADASGIPTLLVSRLASTEVKVVLSADGGDELFSGYDVYAGVLKRLGQLQPVPRFLGRAFSGATSVLPSRFAGRSGKLPFVAQTLGANRLRRIRRMGQMLREHPTAGCIKEVYAAHWEPDELDRLIGASRSPRPTADSYPGQPEIQMSLLDIDHYLAEDILTKVDRTTMAVSIEGREPLLDHRLVQFAMSLPQHLRQGALGPKHILKKILYRYVPRELVDRPKQGFAIPLDNWLRSDLKELVHDYLGEARIRQAGIMDADLVAETVKRFEAGDTTLGTPLWSLLAFEMWREQWG